MRRALGSAASRSPSPQPASSTDASAGIMRGERLLQVAMQEVARLGVGGRLARMRAKKSRQAASSTSGSGAGAAASAAGRRSLGLAPRGHWASVLVVGGQRVALLEVLARA